jgi:hypothetical protein
MNWQRPTAQRWARFASSFLLSLSAYDPLFPPPLLFAGTWAPHDHRSGRIQRLQAGDRIVGREGGNKDEGISPCCP